MKWSFTSKKREIISLRFFGINLDKFKFKINSFQQGRKTQKLKYKPKKKPLQKIDLKGFPLSNVLICFFSCLIAGFCLPSNSAGWISAFKAGFAFFALIPFFRILLTCNSIKMAGLFSFVGGFAFNIWAFKFILGIYPLDWMDIPNDLSFWASIIGLLLATLLQASFWAIYGIIFKLMQNTIGINVFTSLKASLLWIFLIEQINLYVSAIPWSFYYQTQQANSVFIQIADFMGASSISFTLIFINITLTLLSLFLFPESKSKYYSNKKNYKENKLSLDLNQIIHLCLQGLVLILILYTYGFFSLANKDSTESFINQKKALLLQADLPIEQTRFLQSNAQSYLKLLNELNFSNQQISLIALPEGSLSKEQANIFSQKALMLSPITDLIIGNYFNDSALQKTYNSAIAFKAKVKLEKKNHFSCQLNDYKPVSKKPQIYIKRILVPFGEFIPFPEFFGFILQKFNLDYLVKNNFTTDDKPIVFDLNAGKFAPILCYEIAYQKIIHQQVKKGAEVLILMGDISWFHSQKQDLAWQMLSLAKFRAIESRRDILIIINQGPLAIINRYGEIKQLNLSSQSLIADYNLNSKTSYFTLSQWL